MRSTRCVDLARGGGSASPLSVGVRGVAMRPLYRVGPDKKTAARHRSRCRMEGRGGGCRRSRPGVGPAPGSHDAVLPASRRHAGRPTEVWQTQAAAVPGRPRWPWERRRRPQPVPSSWASSRRWAAARSDSICGSSSSPLMVATRQGVTARRVAVRRPPSRSARSPSTAPGPS